MAARLQEIKRKLTEIKKDLGAGVGVQGLLFAAKEANVAGVTREIVKNFLSTDSAAQIFKPPPPSKGASVSEGPGFRIQADLVDYKTKKTAGFSVVLMLIDVFTRKVFAKPCPSKRPQDVAPAMKELLRQLQNSPGVEKIQFLTTDSGNEFTNQVDELLDEKDIVHRKKGLGDLNALSIVDRAMQQFKLRMSQNLTDKKGAWPNRVADVVAQQNKAFHSAVRGRPDMMGKAGHEVKGFLALQDNAKNADHNQKLLEKRTKKLEQEGGYRAPIGGLRKFKRGFEQQMSSDVRNPAEIDGSLVTDATGRKVDIKRIQVVNVFSGDASDGMSVTQNPRINAIKQEWAPALSELFADMDEGEERSLAQAAFFLKLRMGDEEYAEALARARVQRLSQVVEHFTDEFELVRRNYYLKRIG